MAGLEPISAGQDLLKGRSVTSPGRVISLVFQNYALFPRRTILGNIEMGLKLAGFLPPNGAPWPWPT
jgi:ABC-type sugar transport system ATPase subunit